MAGQLGARVRPTLMEFDPVVGDLLSEEPGLLVQLLLQLPPVVFDVASLVLFGHWGQLVLPLEE